MRFYLIDLNKIGGGTEVRSPQGAGKRMPLLYQAYCGEFTIAVVIVGRGIERNPKPWATAITGRSIHSVERCVDQTRISRHQ